MSYYGSFVLQCYVLRQIMMMMMIIIIMIDSRLHGGSYMFGVCCALSEQNLFAKGKAIPLQAWTGPEGSRRLRLPDFKTVDT